MGESYIGRIFIVDEDIIYKTLLKIDGIYWTVKNDKIKIKRIEGNTNSK